MKHSSFSLRLTAYLAGAGLLFAGGTTVGHADILRSGAAKANASRNAQARQSAGAEAAAYAQQVQQDRLAKTTQAITAMRNMQAAARAAALQGPNNLGINPNDPTQTLPDVTNGLGPNGLQVDLLNPRWEGANAPTQSQNGNQVSVNIRQTAQQAVLHWSKFNVGKNTSVNFDQRAGGADAGKWVAFNRISDPTGQPSQILGRINAQGQVYVINQNGIIFGGSSQVNTRGLVASSLSLNMDQVARGILNQEAGNARFLLDGRLRDMTINGGRIGDVTVLPGALLSSPTNEAKSGGRILLAGPNVTNRGRILTPDGQTILAAGLQVGLMPHSADDPSLRGLDVFVGQVGTLLDGNGAAVQTVATTAGRVSQLGLIEFYRGNASLAGREVVQGGILESSTSVALNGRVDFLGVYNAVANPQFGNGSPIAFVPTETGTVRLQPGSVTRILPEWSSGETAIGVRLALPSRVEVTARNFYVGSESTILAPNARVNARAGAWNVLSSAASVTGQFVFDRGQIYVDRNALIDVAGSTNIVAPVSKNILELELRGAELARSPLQRSSILRGLGLAIDIRRSGTYAGWDWVGTPLGDVSGFAGLIQRNVGELTQEGGTINFRAGDSVVLQRGSTLDVSGGWMNWQGGMVATSRVVSGRQILDIADAVPDRVYDGLFSVTWTRTNEKYGINHTFRIPLVYSGERFEPGYISGGDAGDIFIQAPAMALDGVLRSRVVEGPRQIRTSTTSSTPPRGGRLDLRFVGERRNPGQVLFLEGSPNPPSISFRDGTFLPAVGEFALDGNGDALGLSAARLGNVILSPSELEKEGFQFLSIDNGNGEIVLPEGVGLRLRPQGEITLKGSKVVIAGSLQLPGGLVSLTAYNSSPYALEQELLASLPPLDPRRGLVQVAPGGEILVSGLVMDDRQSSGPDSVGSLVLDGGEIRLEALRVRLERGSRLDASAGMLASVTGQIEHGNGGVISLLSGIDPAISGRIGGELILQGSFTAFGGYQKDGGELNLRAQQIQVGGAKPSGDTFYLPEEFFRQGGFSSFSLIGVGQQAPGGGLNFLPAIRIAAGTVLRAEALSLFPSFSGSRGLLGTRLGEVPQALRPASRFAISGVGVSDPYSGLQLARGDVILEEAARIEAGPRGVVGLTGQTVQVLGSILAPGGQIAIRGATNSISVFPGSSEALTTVYLGPRSFISAAGQPFYTPDTLGRLRGSILDGGSVSITGNIAALAGSIIDVSGSSGLMDLTPAELGGLEAARVPRTSGLTSPLFSREVRRVLLESNGGSITLSGGQMLYSSAELRGQAGGPTALGGRLTVASGIFSLDGNTNDTATNLRVEERQAGLTAAQAPGIGRTINLGGSALGSGRFALRDFKAGGFDILDLQGNIELVGPVSIEARRALRLGTGGVLTANAPVRLKAPYVALGQAFRTPAPPNEQVRLFQSVIAGVASEVFFPPTGGNGRLTVEAGLLDLGTLSLQGISRANFQIAQGDVRGGGTFHILGDLVIRAGQVYPVLNNTFNLIAYDPDTAGGVTGSIRIERGASRPLPFSAGGSLNLYASKIVQAGVLRAPFGSITLGWDGSGTAPRDPIAGGTIPFPITESLTLADRSLTSVSGLGLIMPYGISSDGNSWADPRGLDVTTTGLPNKAINLSGRNITTAPRSVIDLRGGGELIAFRFIAGNGGPEDILASNSRFAVLPGYDFGYAPFLPFNSSTGNPGYVNPSLSTGDRIFLNAGAGLAEGFYTLLPARFALLPGAVLVTPSGSAPAWSVTRADGSSLVGGYRDNGLNADRSPRRAFSGFELAPSEVVQARAEYEVLGADTFFARRASELGILLQEVPADSGRLGLRVQQGLDLQGRVLARSSSGGRGSRIDLSIPGEIFIGNSPANSPAGATYLSSSVLSSWSADSLLIGGSRSSSQGLTTLTVTSPKISVDNRGRALRGPEIILAAREEVDIRAGSILAASGRLSGRPDRLVVDGDGVLARISSGAISETTRTGVTASTVPVLRVGADVVLSGAGVTLDSSSQFVVDGSANVRASFTSLRAGRISLELDNPGALEAGAGLVLRGDFRDSLAVSGGLSLQSYSSIDFYGAGQFGVGLGRLELNARQLRGFNGGGGEVILRANSVRLANTSATILPGVVAGPSGGLSIQAGSVELGEGRMNMDQFDGVEISATRSVQGLADGQFRVAGDLQVSTPSFGGQIGSNTLLESTGELQLSSLPGSGSSQGGLGAILNLQGSSVLLDTEVFLPSGALLVTATAGDLTFGSAARVRLGATRQSFFDQARYTDAGTLTLSANGGDVLLAAGSEVHVAGLATGGNAGSVGVRVPDGQFRAEGLLDGFASEGFRSGSFLLDAGTITGFAELNVPLDTGGFFASRAFRVRSGNLLINSEVRSGEFRISTDDGDIRVANGGFLNASGVRGGRIDLSAGRDLVLENGARLSVRGQTFDSAGKGGKINLEAGAARNGQVDATAVLDLQTGSEIDLRVDAHVPGDFLTGGSSAFLGRFEGTLHLRAPQNSTHTDLQMEALGASVLGGSHVLAEGFRVYDLGDYGGFMNTFWRDRLKADGEAFLGVAGVDNAGLKDAAIRARLTAGNAALVDRLVLAPGYELINTASPGTEEFQLVNVGSSIELPTTGADIFFPHGTPGNSRIRSSSAGVIISATGVETPLARNVDTVIPAGSTVRLALGGILSYRGTASGPIQTVLESGVSYVSASSTGASASIQNRGTILTLTSANTSVVSLAAGARVTLPSGTVSSQRILASVPGQINLPDGTITALAANTPTIIPAGSAITLSGAGTLRYSGSTEFGVTLALASGTLTTSGPIRVAPSSGGLFLGESNRTGSASPEALGAADWDLSSHRFGQQAAPGVLTLRSPGNLIFNNTLSDGFNPFVPTGNAMAANAGNSGMWLATLKPLDARLPVTAQSWSYRLVAGADLSAADVLQVQSQSELSAMFPNGGTLGVGEFYPAVPNSSTVGSGAGVGRDGQTADTIRISSDTVNNNTPDTGTRFEVVRTGTGSIEVRAARDVQLRNQFSTIYTAGVALPNPTRIFQNNDFSLPINLGFGPHPDQSILGAPQQNVAAAYAMAGGNLDVQAGRDVARVTLNRGDIIVDTSRQVPSHWLYRRGFVNESGIFGTTSAGGLTDASTSTTWWVDYSNFFQGFGALGGGNLRLQAGRDLVNADAAIPTNARMAGRNSSGQNIAPNADLLLEHGGGDLTVQAGRNIDGGTYYVERGQGEFFAAGEITTNSAKSPSRGILAGSTIEILDPQTWQALTLFGGRTQFRVEAKGDVLMGPVAHAFLLPQGLSNKFWYKTQFATYGEAASVQVQSLGGDVTHRLSMTTASDASPSPILGALLGQFSSISALSIGYYQPWLRLAEPNVSFFNTLFTVTLPVVESVAFSGDINLGGVINLAPSRVGNLNLLARGAILGLQDIGFGTSSGGLSGRVWSSARINLSDANPAAMRSAATPLAYQALVGGGLGDLLAVPNAVNPVANQTEIFDETGSFVGEAASINRKQSLHAPGLLHRNNNTPARIYAAGGDISGLTMFSGKFSRIVAGRDITDVAIYLQNVAENHHSVVSAGRDLVAFNSGSIYRTQANSEGNLVANAQGPLAGDLQIAGPGTLQVLSGRNLDLGSGLQNADGTGAGIVSIGNGRNPFLPTTGANLLVTAGLGGAAESFFASPATIKEFISRYVTGGAGANYLAELGVSNFETLNPDEQSRVALEVFYRILRDAGRGAAGAESPLTGYADGFTAIAALFGSKGSQGDVLVRARDIRTKSGGNIQILAPSGKVELASAALSGGSLTPPGIVTEGGGSVQVFTEKNVNIGIGRIFTLRGGDIVIWSSSGDIAAGSSSKTVQAAPPTRVVIDPQSGLVETDLAGLATGGGIGVLATVAGVAPGNVDLVAPGGVVDAGDAGIQSTGNLIIAATAVVNAGNIAAGGVTAGASAPAAPSGGAAPVAAAPTSPTAANNQVAENMANQSVAQAEEEDATPSLYTVEILGYGGGEDEEDEERASAPASEAPSA